MSSLFIVSRTYWRRVAIASLPAIILDEDVTMPEHLEYRLATKALPPCRDVFHAIDRRVETVLSDCYAVIQQGRRIHGGGVHFHLMEMVYRAHDSWTALEKEWLQTPLRPECLKTFYRLLEHRTRALFMPFHLYIRPHVREVLESINTPPWDMIDTIIKTQKFFLPPGFGADLDGWAAQSLALATQGAIKVILKKRGLPNTESILDDTTRLREELPFSIQHLISQHHPILGEGGFGQVLWLQTDSPPTAVALKTFTKRLHKFKWRDFVNEVMIHRALSNEPHVIRCHGATIIMGNKPNPLILMEPLIPPPLAPASYGSLETIGIQIKQKMPPEFAILALRYFQRQAISAVESVHARGFLHLDIKPNNFVVGFQNERWLLKITDFGFSENRDALHSTPGEYQARGSACMVSPEICDDQLPDYPADIFSLGATLYFTETNQTPFKMGKISAKPNSKRVLSHRSIETIAHLKPLLPSDISTWIIQALDEAPSRRPTASEMHKWWATLSPPEDYPSHAFDTYFSSQKSPNS